MDMFGCTKWGPRLDVDIQTSRDRQYNLPRIIFSANSLTTFRLVNCKLEQPSDTLSLYVLKRLTLVKVRLTDQVVQKHTSECPLLEELSFHSCRGLKCFCIFKPLKLKVLCIQVSWEDEDDIESIKIGVRSLKKF